MSLTETAGTVGSFAEAQTVVESSTTCNLNEGLQSF